MFKVVPDQLRISAGWVRCGVCGEIFDAMPHMLPEAEGRGLESSGSFPTNVPLSEGTAHSENSQSASGSAPDDALAGDRPSESNSVFAELDPAQEEGPLPQSTPGDAGDVESEVRVGTQDAARTIAPLMENVGLAGTSAGSVFPDAGGEPTLEADQGEVATKEFSPVGADLAPYAAEKWMPPAYLQSAIQNAQPSGKPVHVEAEASQQGLPDSLPSSVVPETTETLDTADERWWPRAESIDATPAPDEAVSSPEPVPSFVKQARRRAFLRSRGVRVVLWLTAILVALGLGLQLTIAQRDWLAASAPRLAPFLESMCGTMGCVVSPYRDLNAIVIDGSSFQRVSSDSFRLNVSLRNNGDLPVAPPSLELTLTDAQDQVLLRRVVTADEMSAPRTLNAHGEFNGSSAVSVEASDPAAIVGYRLTAFYP